MKDLQTRDNEQGTENPSPEKDRRSDYYYDDSTGYEIFDADAEEEDTEEERDNS